MATTANIMSLSPKAAPGRAAAAKTGSHGASGMKEFHEIFGKSATSKDAGLSSPEEMAKDPISAAIAATSQASTVPQASTAQQEQAADSAAAQAAGLQEEPVVAAANQLVDDAVMQIVPAEGAEVAQNPEDLAAAFLKASGQDTISAAQLQTLMPQSAEDGQKSKSMLDLLSGQGWKQAETTPEQQPLVPQGIQQPAVQQAQMVDRPKMPEQSDGQIPKNLLSEVPVTVIREDAMPKLQDTMPKPQDTMPKPQDTMPRLQGQQMAAVQQNAPSAEALGTVPRMPEQAVEMTEVLPAGKQPESAEAVPAGQSSAAVREVSVNPEAVQERAVHGAAAAQSVQANAKPEAAANVMTQQTEPEKIEFEPLRQLHQQPDMEQPSQQDTESGREQGFRSANEGQSVRQAAENLPSSAQQNAVNFQQSMQSARAGAVADVQAPVSQLTQDFDIPEQIVEQARLIRRTENTEMVIRLKPEHLGELTLKVTVATNGSVNASFHSDNAQVRAIIENSLVQLKQELSNQGIKVDNVEVSAELNRDGLLNGQGQQPWQQGQQNGNSQAARSQSLDFESFEEESAELAASSGQVLTEEGVDYRV